MMWVDYLIYVFLGIGLTFNGLGAVGLLRFPDVYTRLHAATKTTTFGSIFTSLGVIAYGITQLYITGDISKNLPLVTHTIIAVACLILTNPVSAHAVARAAHRSGVRPVKAVVDKLAEVRRK